jgi:hypothetical protein
MGKKYIVTRELEQYKKQPLLKLADAQEIRGTPLKRVSYA